MMNVDPSTNSAVSPLHMTHPSPLARVKLTVAYFAAKSEHFFANEDKNYLMPSTTPWKSSVDPFS